MNRLLILIAFCFASCGTPQEASVRPPAMPRVTETEIEQITPVVYAYISQNHISDTIAGFDRQPDAAIGVQTSQNNLYIMRKSGSTWRIVAITDYHYEPDPALMSRAIRETPSIGPF